MLAVFMLWLSIQCLKFTILLSSIFFFTSCSLGYVIKQGFYQISLVANTERIEIALRSKNLDDKSRKKLVLIRDVREFSADHLKLVVNKNYKNVNLSWRNTIYNISASDPLKFKPHLWWFPIIGAVPYKGFFDQSDAQKEEARLKMLGLETQLRQIQGYSTLGFFSDPIWPAMLTLSDQALIELIIHELAHATVYIANQTSFNETFANFVGKFGAKAYIKTRFGEASKQFHEIKNYYRHLQAYRGFFQNLYYRLDNIYNSSLVDEEKKIKKKATLKRAEIDFLKLPIAEMFKGINWANVNNAYLLSFKIYNQDEEIFQRLLQAVRGDFSQFLEEVSFYAQNSDSFSALRTRIEELKLSRNHSDKTNLIPSSNFDQPMAE
jgi:predicted aminopeptidase